MDEFVRNKLTEWGLTGWIGRFKEEEIDEETFYYLDNREIDNLISKAGPRAKFKKKLGLLQQGGKETAHCAQQEDEDCVLVVASTSNASAKGKRKRRKGRLQGEPITMPLPPIKRRPDASQRSFPEKHMLSNVKNIMEYVNNRIPNQDNQSLNAFLKNKISDLKIDKRELIGVFGKTGAGKSSLINAIIGEEDLLPSGSISACTSVVIEVQANMQSLKYEAHIEFISEEEWKEELWASTTLRENADQDQEKDADYHDTVEKLSALYGEDWKYKSTESLMDKRHFREIPEFLQSRKKILICDSAKELNARCVKYTRSDSDEADGKEVKKWYWPLVKCVTVRVPNNELLQHVTLVDLPGNGDRNKSRNEMWKGVVGNCTTAWIVAEINRAATETETWEILESASSLMGNGGQCQEIHFICSKSDVTGKTEARSAGGVRAFINKRNVEAKDLVTKRFKKLPGIKNHFNDESFKVFTVSSDEFLKKEHLTKEETEIPKLQEYLKNLNDCHSETLNYVSGAHGILSLIQGARSVTVPGQKTDVCTHLERHLKRELDKITEPMDKAYRDFRAHLRNGVAKSKTSCEDDLHSILYPKADGRGFHMTLKCVVKNKGIHKPKKGKEINLNVKLASYLTDSIDEEFKNTFPNDGKRGPFNRIIRAFSLDIDRLIEENKDVKLHLIFLKTEEEKMKTKLNKIIRHRKKTVYSSLVTTIEKIMQKCYDKAATFKGQDVLKKMRDTIQKHVHDSKDTMFEKAKEEMLKQLRDLKVDILKTLEEKMLKSIQLSLRTDSNSIPDVSRELAEVKRFYKALQAREEKVTPIRSAQTKERAEARVN